MLKKNKLNEKLIKRNTKIKEKKEIIGKYFMIKYFFCN